MSNQHKNPWDRLPNEPMKWFKRFEAYRLAGTDRSMSATYREERARKGIPVPTGKAGWNIPSAWSINAQKWQWKKRVEAWDEAEAEREREMRENLIREEREGRIQMLVATRRMLARELQEMVQDPAKIRQASLAQVANALETVFRLQRDEFGESRDRLEISGPDGGPVRSEAKTTVDLDALSDGALEEILVQLRQEHDIRVGPGENGDLGVTENGQKAGVLTGGNR